MSRKHDAIIHKIRRAKENETPINIILNNNRIIECDFNINPLADIIAKDGLLYIINHLFNDSGELIPDVEELYLKLDDISAVLLQRKPYEWAIHIKGE